MTAAVSDKEAVDDALLEAAIALAAAEAAEMEAGLLCLVPPAKTALARLKSACPGGKEFEVALSSKLDKCYYCKCVRPTSLATWCTHCDDRVACLPCAGDILKAAMSQETAAEDAYWFTRAFEEIEPSKGKVDSSHPRAKGSVLANSQEKEKLNT